MKDLRFSLFAVSVIFLLPAVAAAQTRLDIYFGMGTARDDSTLESIESPDTELGLYGTFGGAVMFRPGFGIGAQVSLRFKRGDYGEFQYRPVLYDFNGIWTPRVSRRVMLEFQGGFGGLNLKFYRPGNYSIFSTGLFPGSYSVTNNVVSRNKLQLHAAAGLRIYVHDYIFIRPQVDYHWVNNLGEFSKSYIPVYTIAVGYNFGD